MRCGLGPGRLAPAAVVVDLVYGARADAGRARGPARGGARFVDGLEVLVRQGALSLELWTGPRGAGRGDARRAQKAPSPDS